MAANPLPPPGSECGPCERACTHRDCQATRMLADSACDLCGDPIGYDRAMFSNWTDRRGHEHGSPVHEGCLLEHLESTPQTVAA